jgi:pentatricopeptide repeat protein
VVTRSPVSVQRVDVQAKGLAMREAKASGNYLQVKEAVRRYVASDSIYVTSLHNAAMDALYATRPRDESIDEILDLYNQLFAHDSLRPDQKSYELIIRTLVQRDGEILRAITTLEKRKLKKMLAMRARGPWNIQVGDKPDTFVLANEVEEMARLKAEDYFSPALKIYQALGTNGDQLGVATINQLIKGAAKRGRTDLALSLFGRIERSPYQLPNGATYATLLQMFGEEKDAEAVMEIFEGYLAARANGLRPPVERSVPAGNAYKMTTTKHRHSASLQSAQGAPREGAPVQIYTTGDDSVWRTAITALFAAGDAVGAVALVERLQEGQAAAKLPPGYTTLKIESFGFSALVGGFLGIKDEESARRWFDRGVPGDDDHDLAERIYSGVLYTALDLEASESMVSHIYRQTLAVPNASIPIGPFVTILDYSIVTAYNGATEAERDAAFENVVFFKQSFETAVQEGRASVPDFTFSTGVLSRILSVAGSRGRFDVAASTYVELSTATVNAILADPAGDDGFRTHSQWAKGLQTMAAAAFGWSPDVSSSTPSLHYVRPAAGSPTPSLAQVVDIVGAFNKGGIAASYGRNDVFEAYVAENYVLAKAAAKGDVTALALSGNQWFTVVKSFANVAAQMARGVQPAFEFAGFEPIIDDFVASGAQLPVADECDYQGLLMALQASGMERSRILAVVSVLDPKVCEMITNGGTPPTSLPPTPPAPTVTVDDLLTGATALDPAAALAAATPPSFPTPPPTPPAYFTELHAPPPVENRGHLNSDLTSKIGSLIYHDKLDQALALLQEKAAVGLLAHPDSIGHLVEGLGREGKRDSLQAAYLLAYASINAMNNDPHGQSISWILLEDRMIIGLAQMGALEEVAVHRDRLLQAGTAPSADGYAAMILNMKETTDDAAVALELFEESQRFNVSPNVYLFNTLISKLSRARRATDALRYFELMKETGLRPTSITYGAIINACCKTGDSPSADYLFQEMVAAPGFKPRVPPYNTMIQFYTQTQPNRERALHFYDQMRAVGVQPTGHTYKLLLDAYGSIGTPDPQSMSDVFDQLLADPLVAVTGAHWASLINAWGCAAKDLDRATAIFDSIEKHPSTIKSRAQLPDAVVFESLLNAFLANGRPDLCDRYLGEMTKRGVRMTAYVANTLIKVSPIPCLPTRVVY